MNISALVGTAVLLTLLAASGYAQTLNKAAGDEAVNSDFLEEVKQELSDLDPSVLEQLKTWNQDILSEENIKELAQKNYGGIARDNPIGFLALMEIMPKEEQRQFLKVYGEQMQQQLGQVCNVYGGTDACMTLPSDSEFARLCPEHDLKVDCAYYREDLQEIQTNPVADIKAALEAAGEADSEAACPQCFDSQRKWFCMNIVPKCGSFGAQVETSILPMAQEIVAAQDKGSSTLAALATAVPRLLKAISLALPCREMCEALMETCACGHQQTFGQLIDSYSAAATGEALPSGFSKQLFGSLHNTSLCNLYSSSTEEGFAGHCEVLPTQCSNQQGWCGQKENPVPNVAQEIMASQLADTVFGFFTSWSPNSMDQMADAADKPEIKDLEDKYIRAGGPVQKPASSSSTPWVWAVVGALLTLACIGAGCAAAYWFLALRQKRSEGLGAQYVAMTEADSLLHAPVAEL